MIVPDHHLADILAGRCTEALIPYRKRLGDRQPIRRPQATGEKRPPEHVCTVRIIQRTTVELDTLTTTQAQAHGYDTVAEWRDDWCRIHGRAWTGERGLLVTFEMAKESTNPFRGPWDPGSPGDIGPERRRAPEPEQVSPKIVKGLPSTMEARQRWARAKLEQQLATEQQPITERIERALAEAREAGVNTDEYEQSILRRVRALENRTKRKAA